MRGVDEGKQKMGSLEIQMLTLSSGAAAAFSADTVLGFQKEYCGLSALYWQDADSFVR